ncbi:MAG: ATP-grasp domain-containing protein [Calditrichaceae bacterium]|nr:ATP-grasp domain-containing protein [Calditrichaceae bacterium]MBN2708992.1 ATP-grasp domain-containing protein [Calditrichaceae bacterium]RQV93337.1 MAG: ATP-grasp domain-containing protein [Calditrichota bacterium]
MKIGFTYDLRQDYLDLGFSELETAEFDRESTIAAIENTLNELGYETERIGNIWSLTEKLAQGRRWDLVFNIAEGMRGIGREAQVPALLDAYDIPYTFSDPLVLSLTLHKGMTKRVLKNLGLPTPDFAEIQNEKDIEKVDLPYPLFAKPIAEGTGKGIDATSKIKNQNELKTVCMTLLEAFKQPVLVETYLPGREFTVGIVGTGEKSRSVGVMEVILLKGAEENAYSFVNKEKCEELVEYRLVDDPLAQKSIEVSLAAWRGLGCRDAGRIDVRTDAMGIPNIIELNPLAGIHPEHSDLPIICNLQGIPYRDLMSWIMESALERMKQPIEKLSAALG